MSKLLCTVIISTSLWASVAVGPAAGSGVLPGEAERQALAALKGRLHGLIVWESNRTGQWQLYVMNADGTGARRLTDLGNANYQGYLRPRISPDGRTILFGYGKHVNAVETWLVTLKGNDARKLCDGLPLNWSADGKRIYLIRDSLVRSHDPATGQETIISPVKLPVDGKSAGTVGMLHPSHGSVAVRAPRTNEYFVFDQGKAMKVLGGCEPAFSPDGRYLYWVLGPKNFRIWEIGTDREDQLLGKPPVERFDYTYFPTISHCGRWLMYGASPGEHDHNTSDYEIYLQALDNWAPTGRPVRLSFNTRTDRWAYLWVAPPGRGSPFPDGPYDVAGNRATNPPPAPRMLAGFSKDGGTPEFGADWGLWPQLDGCRGTVTVLAGQDAEGGPGGALRVEYTISNEPHSFSVYFNSGSGNVDLTTYDRLVLYARGDVPSLTLVVKDRHAADPDAPEGIADHVVTGLTGEWRRFELLFKDFKSRKAGTQPDWSAINHFGLAMIVPQNAQAGTFWVDNLRAEAGP